VGDGVKLGPGTKLLEFSRVAVDGPEEGGGEFPEIRLPNLGANWDVERPLELLGTESNGILWPSPGALIRVHGPDDDDEDEEEVTDELETPQNLRLLRIGVYISFYIYLQ